MRNMKIITCLLTITSLVFTACGGGSNDIEKAKSVATTEHLKQYTEAISHDSCQGRIIRQRLSCNRTTHKQGVRSKGLGLENCR